MRIFITLKFLVTNRIPRIVYFNVILITINLNYCCSQNLYNPVNSEKYAEYLTSSKQFALAAEEYERLIFFNDNNIAFKYKLINSYRLAGELRTGTDRLYSFYGDSIYSIPRSLAKEYMKLELLQDSLSIADKFLHQNNTLSSDEKLIFQCCQSLLSGKYPEAKLYMNRYADNNLNMATSIFKLTESAQKTKFKSPLLAAGLSAIVPGTGKFYTKNWNDGIFSFLFVASNVWQAYRGFSEHGSKSAYGWTFAGLSASFYIGNIFGAVKAARRYNYKKRNDINDQVYEIIRSDSF